MNSTDENKILLTGGVVDLDKFIDKASVLVKEDTILNSINLHNNANLKIKIEKGKKLEFNIFDYAVNLEVNIDVELDDASTLILNDAFISEEKYSLNINTKLYGNDITVEVNVRGINEENGTALVVLNGTVAGETKNSVMNEFAKVLNKSNNSNVLIPNMMINTNEVEANHGVSIGIIDEEELFYLMSKGMSVEHASKIIEDGFLLSIMENEVKERIKNILIGR